MTIVAKQRNNSNRITTKAVQNVEQKPVVLPTVAVKVEADEDGWGKDGLTLKQRRFVDFYVGEAGGNATQAARLAGYRDDNVNALRVTACENLTKPNVARAIERALAKLLDGSKDSIRASLMTIAFQSGADYTSRDSKGRLHVDLDKMAEAGALGLLQSVQEERIEVGGDISTVKLKVKTYDRLKALEILARMDGHMKEADAALSPNVKVYVGVSPDDWDNPRVSSPASGDVQAAAVAD